MFRSLAVVFASLGMVGCASGPRPIAHFRAPVAVTASRAAPANDTTGVWDWMFRSQDDQGDERLEQEEWHLAQRGHVVDGWYDRKVTMLSTDERLFRCNQRLGFTKVTRVKLAGRVEGNRVQLREVAFESKPGPCDDGARNLVAYEGVLAGPTLQLRWGPQAGQTLMRRAANDATPPLLQAADFTGLGSPVRTASTASEAAKVDGTWEWELRSIDAEGDERLEREEWHLTESPDGIRGYYDRTVRREKGDGVYACNGEATMETSTRYDVAGQRLGDTLMLRETGFKFEPSKCDNGQRHLDTYRGHVPDADSLVLSWGPGNQLLRRKPAVSSR